VTDAKVDNAGKCNFRRETDNWRQDCRPTSLDEFDVLLPASERRFECVRLWLPADGFDLGAAQNTGAGSAARTVRVMGMKGHGRPKRLARTCLFVLAAVACDDEESH